MSSAIPTGTLRLRSLRTEASLAIATPVARLLLVGSIVMAVVFCSANLAVIDDLESDGTIQLALHAATVPVLIFSLLAGAYSASTDRRYGFIEQRLLSDTNRSRWLWSKALVQGAVGVVYGLLGVLTAVITCSVAFAVKDSSFDVADPQAVRALIGVVMAAPLLSIIGVFVGALVPNTPMAVAGILVWSLVIEPPVILGLPEVGRWLPTAGALGLTNSPDPDLASQWAGGVALAIYAVVAFVLVRRQLQQIDI